jgi:hypothetical protein
MASEFNKLLLTDFMAHMPPHVLAKNFGAIRVRWKLRDQHPSRLAVRPPARQ